LQFTFLIQHSFATKKVIDDKKNKEKRNKQFSILRRLEKHKTEFVNRVSPWWLGKRY
jgi:hypothetical protein